jgi:hypothetical protein
MATTKTESNPTTAATQEGVEVGGFYSPELSTDFLELPQGVQEEGAYSRFFALFSGGV